MAFVELPDGARLNYRFDGPASAPLLVLSNSLGTDLGMWDPQVPAFARRFRVLRYDTRGHGASAVTPGPYTIEALARDVVHLLDALEIERAHFCGLSMGGMTGMWLGVHHADRVDRLVLCNTGARVGTPELWKARIEKTQNEGMAAVADGVIERWLTPAFREREPEAVQHMRRMIEATAPAGYAACCAAIRDMDQRDTVSRIRAPTLVIAGTHDPATPAADGRFLAERIAGAQYVELPASHLSNIEQPEPFTDAVLRFLS
ncbi:MAG: 3-oxoadipate enol-lactonase [Sulfurifustaceae bacterium]